MRFARAWQAMGLACFAAATADAQITIHAPRAPHVPVHAPAPAPIPRVESATGAAGDLRGRFGIDRAWRLLRSNDADDRLRALERAGAIGSIEAASLLEQAADASSGARSDPRAAMAIARGLASRASEPAAQAALLAIAGDPSQARRRVSEPTPGDEEAAAARVEMARTIAALALAASGERHAVEAMIAMAAADGPGQRAAIHAIEAHPPVAMAWGLHPSGEVIRLAGRIRDRRVLGAAFDAAKSDDAALRAAGIEALATLATPGDASAIDVVRASATHEDSRVRVAAAEALAALGSQDAARVVEGLLADDATAAAGIALADHVHSTTIARALAARVVASADLAVREAALDALGRSPEDDAVVALAAIASDRVLEGDAADALARSSNAKAEDAIAKLAEAPGSRRLAARAYVVRAVVRGERRPAMDALVSDLARSKDGADRAVGAFARIALGLDLGAAWLGDADPRVRSAAAAASFSDPSARAAMLHLVAREPDAAAKIAMSAALSGGDPGGALPTSYLAERARLGEADAPLASLAVASRASESLAPIVDALFASRDPLVRAHVAMGLGRASWPAAVGRLARAYAYEPDASVRRAIVGALAEPSSAPSPARDEVLALAARLDSDAGVRFVADRAHREPRSAPALGPSVVRSVSWLRLAQVDGSPPARGVVETGALAFDGGLAIPVAFDPDGYALLAGAPPGHARLVLAPRFPAAYSRSSP